MLTKLNRTQEKLDVNQRKIPLFTKLPAEVRELQKSFNFFFFFIILCLPKVTLDLITGPVKRGNQVEMKAAGNKSCSLELVVAGFQGTSFATYY